MTQAAAQVVSRHIVVPAPIEKAFDTFTGRFGDFKPPEHNMLRVPIAETVFEPKVGGHIYDRGTDGSECRWARILAYDPPHRVVFSWDIGPTWQVETNPDHTSEVEVTFTAETSDRTRVELVLYTEQPIGDEGARREHYDRTLALHVKVATDEDFHEQERIQANLASGVVPDVLFGRNEPAAAHLHRWVADLLAAAPSV